MDDVYDVAIVGFGPVGQVLAILLGQRGWKVGVFEKYPLAYPLPRAVHFDHEVGRILQAAGVAQAIAATTETEDAYEWRNASGETLQRFALKPTSVSGWPESNMFSQPELERLLELRARSCSTVEVLRGHEAISVNVADGRVRLEVAPTDGPHFNVQASFVVGCDGANSFVRPYLGATVTDLGFFFDWLIVDILPHQPKVWSPLNIQICDPARPTTLVSGGRGRRRWEFMALPDESIEDLNSDATAWRLLAPWSVTPENVTVERHAVYRFQARWVDTWRAGHLLLAGDAAHQMPPFAGQGMCSGLRDAANLAWKLDVVLAGKAPETLLDTYASERIPHVGGWINFSIELGKVICVLDPREAAARDAEMVTAARKGRQKLTGPSLALGEGVWLDGDPQSRRLFVQGRVKRGGLTGRFDDIVGRGFTLVSARFDPAAQLDADAAAFFASVGGITAQVGRGSAIADVDDNYADWFAAAGVAVALQRPDFYIFSTARSAEGTSELVRQLRRSLRSDSRVAPQGEKG
jgi:flavoprotein hydroxylase